MHTCIHTWLKPLVLKRAPLEDPLVHKAPLEHSLEYQATASRNKFLYNTFFARYLDLIFPALESIDATWQCSLGFIVAIQLGTGAKPHRYSLASPCSVR